METRPHLRRETLRILTVENATWESKAASCSDACVIEAEELGDQNYSRLHSDQHYSRLHSLLSLVRPGS